MRIRNILNNNNTGKIYNGVVSLAAATPRDAIDAILETLNIEHGNSKTKVVPATSIGNPLGFKFGDDILMVSVRLRVLKAHKNRDIIIQLYQSTPSVVDGVVVYSNHTYSQYTLPAGQTEVEVPVNILMASTDSLHVDILQNGIKQTGVGLQIAISYFKD